jgi:hypothetical protein
MIYLRLSNGLRRPFSLNDKLYNNKGQLNVSIPNGLRRPFSHRHPGAPLWRSPCFNPERAPQAI